MFDPSRILADIVIAQLFNGGLNSAMVRPQTGLTIADNAFIGVDAHEEEAINKKGLDALDFHG
jgi:hypothetical protein